MGLPSSGGHAALPLVIICHQAMHHGCCIHAMASDVCCARRVLQPLASAAALYEALEDWRQAAAAQHLVALVCQAARRTAQRNVAAAAFSRLSACAEACC